MYMNLIEDDNDIVSEKVSYFVHVCKIQDYASENTILYFVESFIL